MVCRQATTFALVCPGVAFPVFGMFIVKFALLGNGLIHMWTPAMYLFLLLLSGAVYADAQLTMEQLDTLISGNSVSGFADALGKNYTAYYAPEGIWSRFWKAR